jgi:hypothetical protein
MNEDLVKIAICFDPSEAHMIRIRLEEEGIESFVCGEMGNIAQPFLPDNAVEVLIKRSDAEMALKILKTKNEQLPEDIEVEGEEEK